MEKLGEGSCGDKHGGKDDSKTNKKRSVYNLRSKEPKTEGSMGPPTYNLRNKVQKTEGKNASKVTQKRKPPQKNNSKDSSQRRVIPETELKKPHPKTSTFPIIDTGTKKPLTASMPDHDKSQPSSSQFEPFFHDPVYHIRWEGYELGRELCGEICVICNKDLSSGIESDDDDDGESEYNEDSLYGDDDVDVDYGYFDERAPPLLPIVDILTCGHAFHTECLKNGARDEQSGDPICVLCSRMA